MFRFKPNLLLSPEAVAGVGTVSHSADLTKDDIYDALSDDKDETIPLEDKSDKKPAKAKTDDETDDDKEETKKAKTKDDDDDTDETDEDDELKEIEDELEAEADPDEEKLELATPTSRREILKKYPQLFKDFPYLEKAYYREQEFTKLLPTIDDAREAVDKSETLDKFEQDLVGGNTETILRAVKENNPKSFDKIVDDYLVTLSKVDEKAYHHVIGNTIKHTIMQMVREGRASQNEVLENAAVVLNQFVFGSSKFSAPERLSIDDTKTAEDDVKAKALEEREKRFVRQRFNSINGELTEKVNKTYKSTIEANIDPRSSMSDYVRKTASREALEELETLIGKDARFKTIVDKLWERAFKDDFSSDSVAKIRSAFISKAKTLLPTVIKKARNEALRGMSSKSKKSDDAEGDDDSHQSKESKRGRDSDRRESKRDDEPRRRSNSGSSKSVPDGMTSLEYLMSDD